MIPLKLGKSQQAAAGISGKMEVQWGIFQIFGVLTLTLQNDQGIFRNDFNYSVREIL
jgi:hypothetical protein